ncbi:uncharacterized protein C6orf136 homolog isoform X1 [Mustela nigripes]|nr:uncharacterized protein C6orf136 homolog isoform X1 [Mustela nigripes]
MPHRLLGSRCSAQARNISVSLSPAPSHTHTHTPPFPFKKPAPGRAHPCEAARGRTPEALSPLPLDHVSAQPGGGPASRPLPPHLPGSPPGRRVEGRGVAGTGRSVQTGVACTRCWFSRVSGVQAPLKQGRRGAAAFRRRFRGYLCMEDQLSPRTLPFPPLWPPSTTATFPSSLLWSPPPPHPPIWLLPRALPLHLPQIQTRSSPWVVLPPGKGEEGPGPEMHSGCLDGLRSLFEGPPCPCPGALIPFQAPGTSRPSPATPSGDPSMEEHLAVMYERLRQELPNLFLHSHDYTLYSSDVEFINEILNIRTKGRTWYILSLTLCRFLAWNYFAQLRLEVLQLTRHPENWTLQARWRLVGLPIHMLFLRFYKRDKEELYRTYDAYSTFYLNSSGLICRHRLDKLMPSHSAPTPVKKLLVGALVTLGLSEPEPNLHLCSKT